VVCHRPGQSGPFNLTTFEEVRKHAKEIGEVTARRYMPPWLPEKGYGEFAGERRLSPTELGLIQQWVAEGAPEGAFVSTMTPPVFSTNDWQLGQPDLVIALPTPYTLPADGKDVYRNFIIPVPLEAKRFVKAFEFRPGSRTVHHAFIHTDRSRQARRLQPADGAVGFDGMDTPPGTDGPNGFFASWQPGRIASKGVEGLAWELEKNSDIVLQVHMRPSGKAESVQPRLAFYFTDQAPTNTPFKICLTSLQIDIPAGAKDYLIEDSYTMPIDAEVLAILPHAHYLCKEMRGFATLPDGSRKWLLLIRNWDFNWQGDYRYQEPLFLPKGSKLTMQFTYDNSVENIRNPNSPPQRVRYGVQSSDEMGEFWLQVLPRQRDDLNVIAADYSVHLFKDTVDYNLYRLRVNPNDARAHNGLGMAYLAQHRVQEALGELKTAVRLDPGLDEAHYRLGLVFRQLGRVGEAKTEFETAVRLNPQNQKAHGNLGLISMQLNELKEAEEHFSKALQMNPEDGIAHDSLGLIMMQDGRLKEAQAHFREAGRITPRDKLIALHLETVARMLAPGAR
jgi:tetratricopeptide (TPR) repeat protein